MLGSRSVGFDLVLAAIGTGPFALWGIWHWPWEDGWIGWPGWPVIIAFGACFGLARVVGGFYAGCPGLDEAEGDAPDNKDLPSDRPVTLAELAALGIGVAALLTLGWAISRSQPVLH